MTKPIDWESEEQRPAVQVYHRLEVLQQSNLGEDRRWATPSDIASALAAMGEGERAEVLAAFHGDSIVHRHLQEQVERAEANHLSAVALVTELRHKLAAAEGCADACRAETRRIDAVCSDVQRERDGLRRSFNVAMTDCAKAAARAEKAEEETVEARASADRAWRAVSEALKEQRLAEGAQERAERERDEARKELGTLHVERQAIAAAIGLLPGERIGEGRLSVAACLACEERDSLRARLIASETAAAQREPREYPLAEGSSWSGEVIIDGLGQTIRGTETALQISWGSTTRASVWQNVLALAHRRGLL